MSWTYMFSIKAAFVLALVILASLLGTSGAEPTTMYWAFTAYILTAVICVLVGVLMDANEVKHRPQPIEVLLRDKDEAWLLTVMRTSTGELFAPRSDELRKLKAVDLDSVPATILQAPWFSRLHREQPTYRILGAHYTA